MQNTVLTANFKVSSLIFRSNTKGGLFPFIGIEATDKNSEDVLDEVDCDAIMFDSLEFVEENGVKVGSEIEISFDMENHGRPKDFKVKNPRKVSLGTLLCPSCFLPTRKHHCENLICPAKSRTCLYRMAIFAGVWSHNDIGDFLDNFVVPLSDNTVSSIDNLTEFYALFTPLNDYNIKSREDLVDERLHFVELKLHEYLSEEEMKITDFWEICSFPIDDAMKERFPADLAKISPKDIIESSNSEATFELSDRSKGLLVANVNFIKLLYRTVNHYKVKTWI